MVTASLPLSEYSSAYRPSVSGSSPGMQNAAATVSQERQPKSAIAPPAEEKLNFLDNFISFKKSAALKEERFLLVGIFNDIFKTCAKMLTGTFITDVAKSLQKDANLTFEEVIYKTLIESSPSRIFNDLFIAWFVRMFNGNHKLFGIIPLPYLAPEVSSQLPPRILIPLMRSATKEHNINKKSQEKNSKPEELEIAKIIEEKNPLFLRFANVTSGFFDNTIKPYFDKVFKTCLGVSPGEVIKDKEGNPILKENGKPKYSNAKVNKKWLASVMAGSFVGQFFLPKFTMAAGFEKAKSPWRAALSVAFTSLCRLESTLIHNGFGMHLEGANFDKCFSTSVREKMLVPIAQYTADAFGTLFAHKTKVLNGSTMSTIFRVLLQLPCEFLTSPLIKISAKDRVTDDWKFLAYKIWKPVSNFLEIATRPIMEGWFRLVGSVAGMYDPSIPNMYGVDLSNIKRDDYEQNIELSKKFNSNPLSVLGMAAYKTITIPKDIYILLKQCFADSATEEAKIHKIVENKNHLIDLRIGAEQTLEKLDLKNMLSPTTEDAETNEKIIETATRGTKQDLLNFLSKPLVTKIEKNDKGQVVIPEPKVVGKKEKLESSKTLVAV